jgi:hypothetical protein
VSGNGVLGARALNRALLSRQLLLDRADLAVPDALRAMGFLQAQYAPSMYVGLWSRLAGLRRADVTRALEDRTAVQGTLLRATIHLVAADDWWFASAAVRAHRRRWYLRAHRGGPEMEARVETAAERVRDALAGGPRRRRDLVAGLGLESAVWNGVNLWLDLVRVPPSGTWERRSADLYALAEDWIGPPPPEATDGAGLELLLRRYLGAFGPAPLRDAADWAGVPVRAFAAVAATIELRRFRDASRRQLLDLPGAPLPAPETEAPVRFLPTWDAVLLAHARRAEVLADQHRPFLFSTRSPQSSPSFLVDGRVAGTWRFDGDTVRTEPFEPLPRGVRRRVDDEAERVAAFHR